MNKMVAYAVKFVNGDIEAEAYYQGFLDLYYAEKTVNIHYPEQAIFCVNELYNPDDDRFDYELDELRLREQIKQVLEGKHPLYMDINYPVVNLATA